jgi:hypothetical protein
MNTATAHPTSEMLETKRIGLFLAFAYGIAWAAPWA